MASQNGRAAALNSHTLATGAGIRLGVRMDQPP
jgi:hypothetical protein